MKNEPIRHHYIPQFILKNFRNKNGLLLFHNKKTSEEVLMPTREVFMVKNLYRDETNNADNPTKIEKDLAIFESEVAGVINNKFTNLNEIKLTFAECEKLKLFFAIMGFRSQNTSNQFKSTLSTESKKFYSKYQNNGDILAFWKRNLGYLVNCRCLDDVIQHDKIDEPIKGFMCKDVFGFFGQYFVIAERRENKQFLISDIYPTIIYDDTFSIPLHLFSIYPISPNRVILLASYGVENVPMNVISLRNCIFTPPKIDYDNCTVTMRVKRLYNEEVGYINSVLVKEAHKGWAFLDKA